MLPVKNIKFNFSVSQIRKFELAGLVLLFLVVGIGFFVFPTYPNYDSYYALLWAREILHGDSLSLLAYRAPTPHVLFVLLSCVLVPFGEHADRLLVGAVLLSYVGLVAGIYVLCRTLFTPLIGLLAASIFLSRFDFSLYAMQGYLDIPYLALLIWGLVLELKKPKCGTPVFILFLFAGLLRPEAWVFSGLYFLWVFRSCSWRRRFIFASLVAVAPVIWVLFDLIATGHPLHSFTATNELAGELRRSVPAVALPEKLAVLIDALIKPPVILASLCGIGLAWYAAKQQARVLLVVFASGVLVFLIIGLGGLSMKDRYVMVPAIVLICFTAFAVGGWQMLPEEAVRAKKVWSSIALALTFAGIAFTLTHLSLFRIGENLHKHREVRIDLRELLAKPAVQKALKCGPVTVPNHRLIPDIRWVLDRSSQEVLARSSAKTQRQAEYGVALTLITPRVRRRFTLDQGRVGWMSNLPPDGFHFLTQSQHYAAFVRCR